MVDSPLSVRVEGPRSQPSTPIREKTIVLGSALEDEEGYITGDTKDDLSELHISLSDMCNTSEQCSTTEQYSTSQFAEQQNSTPALQKQYTGELHSTSVLQEECCAPVLQLHSTLEHHRQQPITLEHHKANESIQETVNEELHDWNQCSHKNVEHKATTNGPSNTKLSDVTTSHRAAPVTKSSAPTAADNMTSRLPHQPSSAPETPSRPQSATNHPATSAAARGSSSKSAPSFYYKSAQHRARRVRFYRNGDRFFKGMVYAVSTERFRSFEALLTALTSSTICDNRTMPHGVRTIFSLDGARRISSLRELEDGESYVCASSDIFRTLDYSKNEDLDWRNASPRGGNSRVTSGCSSRSHKSHSSQSQNDTPTTARRNSSQASSISPSRSATYHQSREPQRPVTSQITPRLITVLKQGKRPRKAVRLLLNRKTAQNFDQVMSDITQAVKMDCGNVRKLFGLSGRPVMCLQDFFAEDTIFIACGKDKMSTEQLDLDRVEVRQVNAYRPFSATMRDRVTLRRARTKTLAAEQAASQGRTKGGAGESCDLSRSSSQNKSDSTDVSESMMSSSCTTNRSHTPNTSRRQQPHQPHPHHQQHQQHSHPQKQHPHPQQQQHHPQKQHHHQQQQQQLQQQQKQQQQQQQQQQPQETSDCHPDAYKTKETEDIPKPITLTNKYEVGPKIGTGNFAVVLECREKKTKRKYALKIINKASCKGKERMIDNEVRILRYVNHPNIIRLIEDFCNKQRIFYIMELVKGGDLFDAIASSTKYTETDASGMLHNLVSALDYLHAMRIVHRDVKPENLLIQQHDDGTKSLKLGDFGLATEVKGQLFTVCGTPTYVAPEVIAETGYGVKIDVWSAGVIAYILLCGFPPFSSPTDDQDELFDLIMSVCYDFPYPYWEDISQSAKNLIRRMLELEPDKRLTAAQVLQHKWVAGETSSAADLQKSVSSGLGTYFRRSPRNPVRNAGIQIMATTALDKVSRYFQGRGAPVEK